MSDALRISGAAQKRLGLPEGLQFFSMGDFAGGMNQQDARTALKDSEAFWVENMLLLGRGRYRSLYDAGSPLYTAPGGKSILWFKPFILAHTPHHFVVFSDGTGVDVNQSTGAVMTVSSTPQTFYNPVSFPHGGVSGLPDACQWGSQYLLIANNNTSNSYWVWDGTLLYGAGTLAPIVTITNGGSGYSATPSISVSGGSGSGATFSAVVQGGIIIAINVTNPGSGWTAGQTVTVHISDTTGTSAAATVDLMPFGISGDTIETFDSRVWLAYPREISAETGGVFNVSAPGSFTNFAQSAGAVLYTSTDRYLRSRYNLLRQSNGYLYPFGDSSVSIISNVQTSGTTTVSTTFNYQSTDPQVGIAWRDTAQDFSRTILFANPTGVYGLYGGAVRKVSSRVLDLFDKALFPPTTGALRPSAAVMNIHTVRCYLILMTITDPFTFQPRNVILCWDETQWVVVSQTPALTFINTQEVDSALTAWGTDGTSIYPLLATPSPTLQKRLVTKYFGSERDYVIKQPQAFYFRCQDQTSNGVAFAFTFEANGIAPQASPPAGVYSEPPLANSVEFAVPQPSIPPAGAPITTYPVWAAKAPDVFGSNLGLIVASFSPDFELNSLTIAYQDIAAVGF